MVLITIVIGAYKPTNITGGPHIVWDVETISKFAKCRWLMALGFPHKIGSATGVGKCPILGILDITL